MRSWMAPIRTPQSAHPASAKFDTLTLVKLPAAISRNVMTATPAGRAEKGVTCTLSGGQHEACSSTIFRLLGCA
jgi:hypothetical protein